MLSLQHLHALRLERRTEGRRLADVVHLLLAEGVLDAASVVDDGVTARDLSSRNRNALVSRRGAAGLFVKRGEAPGQEGETIRRLRALPALSGFLPEVVHSGDVLVLASPQGAADLWSHHAELEAFPEPLGRAVGRALGLLHRHTARPARRAGRADAPWVLAIHRPGAARSRLVTPASVALIRTLQADAGATARLDELREHWSADATIHADVKWANILTVPSPAGEAPAVQLVDWEHAVEGDPAWDLGSALAAYLTFWLRSISITGPGADGTELASTARVPLAAIQPAMAALWDAYLLAAPATVDRAGELRRRTAALCAARLIQTAFEESETRERLSGSASLHLQVAVNMLADPDAAAARLLGIGGAAR